jgi:hypothetical protein
MQPSSFPPPYANPPSPYAGTLPTGTFPPNPSPIGTGPRTGMPPVRRPLRRLLVLTGLGIAALAIGIGAFLLWLRLDAHHRVLIDNANDFAVDVEIDGEKLALAPHTSRSVKVDGGRLEVRASGPKGWTESASLDLPGLGWGLNTGRTAVYNVGGVGALAMVTMTYGSVPGAPPPLVELSRADKLQLLPAGSYGDIDEAFPTTVKSKRRGEFVQRVCHLVDGAKAEGPRVGCAH